MSSFPALFLVVTGAALVLALAALFRSLRAAFGGEPGWWLDSTFDEPDPTALVEEKRALLRAIKDLEYERAMGKISEADYQRLDAAYRARAKQVLAELDRDRKPFEREAERLIADRLKIAEKLLDNTGPQRGKEGMTASERARIDVSTASAAPSGDVWIGDPSDSARPAAQDLNELLAAAREGRLERIELAALPDAIRAELQQVFARTLLEYLRAQGSDPRASEGPTSREGPESSSSSFVACHPEKPT